MSDAPEPGRDRDDSNNDGDDEPPELLGPSSKRWGTVAIIVLNLAVGVVMAWAGVPTLLPDDSTAGALVAFGAVEPTRVWSGEVWRLFTACFVHVASWHLGLNLFVLWQVGRALERLIGTARYVLVYAASGIFGFALSIALLPTVTAGASGAVFGVTGALLAIAALTQQRPLGRFLLTSFVPFVVATGALGVLLPFINNVAHFGGLVLGFVLTWGLCAGDRSFVECTDAERAVLNGAISDREKTFGPVALVVALALFAGTVVYAVEPRFSPRFHAMMGLRALHTAETALPAQQKEALDAARAHAERAKALGKDDASTWLLQSRLQEHDGAVDDATASAARAFAGFSDGVPDRYNAFNAALSSLGLEEAGEMPFSDGFTTRLLCNAALAASTQQAPLLKNACAWLFLRANEEPVRDPLRALELSQQAWEEAKTNAAIVHTYACALAQNGQAAEGLALLELLVVSGDLDGLPADLLASERVRLKQLADTQATKVPTPAEGG